MPLAITLLGGERKGDDQGGEERVRTHGREVDLKGGYGREGRIFPTGHAKVKTRMTRRGGRRVVNHDRKFPMQLESRAGQTPWSMHVGLMKNLMLLLPAVLVLVCCDKKSDAAAPKAAEVQEESAADPKTPGDHLDKAIQKTGEGLQVAGEKTEEGLKTAREKTEVGLDKAAEATGKFLKRVGEKIEEQAEKPVPPEEEP